MPARRTFDPDADDVRPAQHVVPADLPGTILTGPVVPAAYEEPAGELPTPTVTLNIEGSDVAPTGQAVVYKLHVRNASRARAHNVVVRVTPPKNATKVKADPRPTRDEAESTWEFKTLEPGHTRTIELAYAPNKDVAEVKVQARVQFDFGRGMVTRVSAPELSVKRDSPETMVVGDTERHRITVTNTGRVTIRDIKVREVLGKGLVLRGARDLPRDGGRPAHVVHRRQGRGADVDHPGPAARPIGDAGVPGQGPRGRPVPQLPWPSPPRRWSRRSRARRRC